MAFQIEEESPTFTAIDTVSTNYEFRNEKINLTLISDSSLSTFFPFNILDDVKF